MHLNRNLQQRLAFAVALNAHAVGPSVAGSVNATTQAFVWHQIQMLNFLGKWHAKMCAAVDVRQNITTASEQNNPVGFVGYAERNQMRAAIGNAAELRNFSPALGRIR